MLLLYMFGDVFGDCGSSFGLDAFDETDEVGDTSFSPLLLCRLAFRSFPRFATSVFCLLLESFPFSNISCLKVVFVFEELADEIDPRGFLNVD